MSCIEKRDEFAFVGAEVVRGLLDTLDKSVSL